MSVKVYDIDAAQTIEDVLEPLIMPRFLVAKSDYDALAARLAKAEAALREAAGILTNAAQIIDVTRQEWLAENAWSEWDQSVRDSIGAWLIARDAALADEPQKPT